MLMSIERRAKRPAIYLYKHRNVEALPQHRRKRRHLRLPTSTQSLFALPGSIQTALQPWAAIDGLHLYELPWMQEELADEQYSLP